MSYTKSSKLSSKNLWGYALGAVPTALLGFIFTLKYIEFFFDKLKLDPTLFIIGQVIYMTINSLNDPLSGQLSDRTNREKWGSRRLIYIRYGGPIWCFTLILVYFPWSLTNQWIIFLHYIISICLFDTMLTLVVLVWLAILPEMTESEDERNKAQFLAGILGLLAAIPFFLIVVAEDPTSDFFKLITIVLAIISSIILYLVSVMCEERPEFQKDEVFPLGKSLKEAFRSRAFTWYVGFYFCMNLLSSLGLSYLFVYLLLLDRISPGEAVIFFFAIYFFIGFGGQIYCMSLRKKWGMRKVILVFGVLKIISLMVIFVIILDPSLEFFIWVGLIFSTFFGGYAVYHIPGQHLAIDQDEVIHGTRREGIFMGIMALLTKPATSLGPIIATIILVNYGYDQGASKQPESLFLGIKILMFLFPAIVSAVSLVFIYFYPLHGEALEEMQSKLNIIHQEKRKAREKKEAEEKGWLKMKQEGTYILESKLKLRRFPKLIAEQLIPLKDNEEFQDKYAYSNIKILLNSRDGKYAALIYIFLGTLQVIAVENTPKENLIQMVKEEEMGFLDTTMKIFLDISVGKMTKTSDYLKKILARKLKVKNVKKLMILQDLFGLLAKKED